MFDLKQIINVIEQIAEEKKIAKEKIVEAVETALGAAYRKEYGNKSQIIRAKIDFKTGDVSFYLIKIAIDSSLIRREKEEAEKEQSEKESSKIEKKTKETEMEKEPQKEQGEKLIRFNPEKHILLNEARKINPKAQHGDEIIFPLESHQNFGRIAAQTAKQIIVQKIKEIEYETIYEEFKAKEGEIISGIIQRVDSRNIYVDLAKTIGILPFEEGIITDHYRPNQRLKFLIMRVEQSSKGPLIFLSRNHPQFLVKLFELEVPEIKNGTVEIKAVAREGGSRSKIAVFTTTPGVDPIGSCVGQRGIRVQMISNELNGEKIDIVLWDEDPKKYIANALSPAKPLEVIIKEKEHKALVKIGKETMSLAIGLKGQNVRLAAKLTTWKIDIQMAETGEITASSEDKAEAEEKTEEENKK